MQIKKIIIFILLLSISGTLFSQKDDILFKDIDYYFPYSPGNPDQIWELPRKLTEISGLGIIDSNRLACVQDEKGNIYVFNLLIGEIEKKIDFGDDGDYEGVAIVNNDAWMLKSNGTLIEVVDFMNFNENNYHKHSTALKKKNDCEGLAYNPNSKQLLIACKGHPYIGDKKSHKRKAFYHFDLTKNKLNKTPFLIIKNDSLKVYRDYNTMTRLGVDFLALLDDSKGDLSFQPSAIAIHPITGNLYILAAVGNLMVVVSNTYKILAIVDLKSSIHKQPEGICFDNKGTMYIANEGNESKGKILKFKMH
jgi:uncharacterized protein YjiK